MNIGQTFRPYKMFHGAFVPNWLLCKSEVSHGAKLLYAVMARHEGKEKQCFAHQETLALEIGLSVRQTRDYLQELITHRLIRTIRRGLGLTNDYVFLWHEWMDETGSLPPDSVATSRSSELRHVASPSVQEKNHLKETDGRQDSVSEEAPLTPTRVVQAELKIVTPNMQRIGKLFRRRENTRWSAGELKSLKLVEPIPEDEMEAVETYYTAEIPAESNFRRRDLATLLNNWSGEVDRARNFKPKKEYNL